MYDYIHFDHDIKYKKYEKKSENRRSKAWFFFFFSTFICPSLFLHLSTELPPYSLSLP